MQHGDRMCREFFRAVGQRQRGPTLTCLQDVDGELHFQPERISEIATSHFRDLYQAGEVTEAVLAAREEIWRQVPRTVTAQMSQELRRPITLEELARALQHLPAGRCPGEDGLPPEFFRQYWDLVGPDLLQAFREGLDRGS
eukprot:c20333_g1_i1 orf=333-755(+)